MTNKVQKIREEVEKRYECWKEKESNSHSVESEIRMSECKHLLLMLNSLQEEPAPKIFEDMLNVKTPAESLGISAEEHEKIIDLCLYGKEPEMVDIDDLPKEEPVCNDLEEVADDYALDDYIKPWRELVKRAFISGAKWQKQQDQSTIELAEDHAMLAGMNKMEEEMKAKAIEGEVITTSDYGWENIRIHKKEHHCGQKVKVIVIKEE